MNYSKDSCLALLKSEDGVPYISELDLAGEETVLGLASGQPVWVQSPEPIRAAFVA